MNDLLHSFIELCNFIVIPIGLLSKVVFLLRLQFHQENMYELIAIIIYLHCSRSGNVTILLFIQKKVLKIHSFQ